MSYRNMPQSINGDQDDMHQRQIEKSEIIQWTKDRHNWNYKPTNGINAISEQSLSNLLETLQTIRWISDL